jgi:hypothetical protein
VRGRGGGDVLGGLGKRGGGFGAIGDTECRDHRVVPRHRTVHGIGIQGVSLGHLEGRIADGERLRVSGDGGDSVAFGKRLGCRQSACGAVGPEDHDPHGVPPCRVG